MSEANKKERVVLEMTREQAEIVERACELLARLRLGQLEQITEACLDFGSAEYCKRRDYVNPFFEAAAKVIYGVTAYGYPDCKKDDVFRRAWSVYEVLRYTRCWHDHPEGGSWSVCFDPPLNMSPAGEPLPKCEILDSKPNNLTKSENSQKAEEESMEDENRIIVIPINMDNRDPKDIARDIANKIGMLMDQLMKQTSENQNQQKREE